MVIGDFDIPHVAVAPIKANAPLPVNANTPLALPIARQLLQLICGRHSQITQRLRMIEQIELFSRPFMDHRRQCFNSPTSKNWSYCQIWCMTRSRSGGLPADLAFIDTIDELDSVNNVGQLFEAA